MDVKQEIKRFIVDRDKLPQFFPTHRHSPQFWEHLGRTIATFGFLEEVLGKAIFAFTAKRRYGSEEIEKEYNAWLPKLERALSNPLCNRADSYGKAVKEHPDADFQDIDKLVCSIKEAAEIRNVFCHASWHATDDSCKSLPLFVNRDHEIFDMAVDIAYFEKVRTHVVALACLVMDTVTQMGLEFPGSSGTGKNILGES